MTNSEWIALLSILLTGFGGLAAMMFKMNGTLGKIEGFIDNHEKRIAKLEKNTAKRNR
ncbi:MAG TPA: hypothetical protein VFE50_16930 [Cyclobacteriaceae bacterium]|nr:hypothetical protein [Cyclobacteriaceae bacterium]